ncbi:MAG: isochorismatase family cysteine hydrolase [Chloroflexota bacterium]
MAIMGADITKSALIIVDMQNDFLNEAGHFGKLAKQYPERKIDMEFLGSTIPNVKRLAVAFRAAKRPVIYLAHIVKEDYSDAAFPYWRSPPPKKREFLVEGMWGAQITDELKPQDGEHLVIKKGFGGFYNTHLDTVLRNLGVTTCVMCGVTTAVCVSTTTREGVELNYRMIVVSDAVAERSKELHEAELRVLAMFTDVRTTDEVVKMLEREI